MNKETNKAKVKPNSRNNRTEHVGGTVDNVDSVNRTVPKKAQVIFEFVRNSKKNFKYEIKEEIEHFFFV